MSHGCADNGLLVICSSRRFFFLLQNRQRIPRKFRRDDDLAENLRNRRRTLAVEQLVDRDDAAKGSLPIRRERLVPRLAQIRALPDAARIRMFENRQGRHLVTELRDQRRRRRQIQNVVVGKLLTLKLLKKFMELAVERRRLVRISP